MSKEDLNFIDFFSAMDLNRTDANKMDPLSLHSDTNTSPFQTISKTSQTRSHHLSSSNDLREVRTPHSFPSNCLAPMSSMQRKSALTERLKGDSHAVSSTPAANQPMNWMLNYDNIGRLEMPVFSDISHYSPMNGFGSSFHDTSMLPKKPNLNEQGAKVVKIGDAWTTSPLSHSYGLGRVQTSSMTSQCNWHSNLTHGPYHCPLSIAPSRDTPELIMGSPLAPIVTMNPPPPFASRLSPVSTAAGFTPEQVPAAQAIVEFIVENPGTRIPATLITRELVETSTEGKGYCLIGNCGVVRAGQKADPHYDPYTDKEYRKRIDHLRDHVKDKHFSTRPFTCSYPSCTAAFAREADLKRHGEIHNGVKICCPEKSCGKSYTRHDNLGRHINTKHPHLAHLLPVNSHVRHSTTSY